LEFAKLPNQYVLWSVASFGAAIATGLKSFLPAIAAWSGRGPNVPGNSKPLATGFLRANGAWQTRASILPQLGPAIGQPLIGLLPAALGWRWSFARPGSSA